MESIITIDLLLDTDEEHPRRLLSIGSSVVCYGGDDGTLALVDSNSARPIRRFDEESLRSVTISEDGKRVVMGSDSGLTQVFVYDDYENSNADRPHPFVANANSNNNDDDDDDNNNFMSQSDHVQAVYAGETVWAGPSLEAPVRQLLFLPHSYHLVVATETSLSIVDVTSPETILQGSQELSQEGVRGVDLVRMTTNSESSDSSDSALLLLSALDMNGRLTHYKIDTKSSTLSSSSSSSSTIFQKETRLAVEKRDVGEMLGASAACRSTRPQWVSKTVLAVGGQSYLQLRRWDGTQLHEEDQPLSIMANTTGNNSTESLLQGHVDSIVYMQALDNKGHVVTCGRDMRLVLWNLQQARSDDDQQQQQSLQAHFVRTLVEYTTSVPTDLLWLAKEERLYVACANGSLVVLENYAQIVPQQQQKVISNNNKAVVESNDANVADKEDGAVKQVVDTAMVDDDDEEEDDDGAPKSRNVDAFDDMDDDDDNEEQSPSTKKNRFVDDEAEDDDDDDGSMPGSTRYDDMTSPALQRTSTNNNFPEQDDDDRSEGGDSFDMDQYRSHSHNHHHSSNMAQATLKLPEPQPAFAPSSTPLDMTRRFLCWNHIGAVTRTQGVPGVSRSSIDMDFTDTLTRRPVSFTDNMGFILGSVGEDGGIFATDLAEDEDDEDDDNLNDVVEGLHMSEMTKAALKKSQKQRMAKSGKATGSTLFFHRFETFAATRDKDWYLTLPDGERALGCACGEGWAAVMTSRRFLRLFSSGGNQGQVIWLPGEPVSMVGRGRFLAVFYHEAPPMMDETQKLGFMLLDVMAARTVTKGSASCISSGSSLAWAGLTNECTLVAMDSDGMLSMLASSGVEEGSVNTSWEWVPALDTVGLRKSFDDSYWPVTVYDGKLVCVPLKGGVKHPDAARRPVTTTLGLRLPLARGTLSSV
jgi:chromosome transmission fidelity protein 4